MGKKPGGKKEAIPWTPIETTAELEDGRTVQAIDDGMFLKPRRDAKPQKPLSSTEEARPPAGEVFRSVFDSLREIEKGARKRLEHEREEFSARMVEEARELIANVVTAKRLVEEREWEMVARYLLQIGDWWARLRIEIDYRRAFMAKRNSDAATTKPRPTTRNSDLAAFKKRHADWCKMKPVEAVKIQRKAIHREEPDREKLHKRLEAFRVALTRAQGKARKKAVQ